MNAADIGKKYSESRDGEGLARELGKMANKEDIPVAVKAYTGNGGDIADIIQATRELREDPGVSAMLTYLAESIMAPPADQPQWVKDMGIERYSRQEVATAKAGPLLGGWAAETLQKTILELFDRERLQDPEGDPRKALEKALVEVLAL